MTHSDPPITYLSPPAAVSMGDSWFDVANLDHFWIRRRFAVFQHVLRQTPIDLTSSVVGEIGCGSGLFQEQFFRAYGTRVDGFDLNEHALRHSVNPANPRFVYDIHSRNRDLLGKYDLLVLFDVIEHIEDDGGFLESVAFHLKPGGHLVINVPAMQWLYSAYDQAAGHVRRYSLNDLRKTASRQGLSISSESYWGMPYVGLLLLRKALLGSRSVDDSTISKGFSPRGVIVNQILSAAGQCEWIPQRFLGSSAMGVFRKA